MVLWLFAWAKLQLTSAQQTMWKTISRSRPPGVGLIGATAPHEEWWLGETLVWIARKASTKVIPLNGENAQEKFCPPSDIHAKVG